MGWVVEGHVTIDIVGIVPPKTLTRIKRIVENEGVYNHKFQNNLIYFTLSGNKGVNYDFLEKVQTLLNENSLVESFEISSCEFMETGDGGYYYNSVDDKEIET